MAHVAPGDSPRHRSKKWPLLNWLGLVLRKTKQNLESENFFEDPFPFGAQRMGFYCQFSTHAHSCRSRQLSRTSRDAKELAVRVLLSAPEKKVTDTALNSSQQTGSNPACKQLVFSQRHTEIQEPQSSRFFQRRLIETQNHQFKTRYIGEHLRQTVLLR